MNRRLPNWLLILFLVFSALGFTDATYLTVAHYTHAVIPCSIVSGCEKVTTSRYAVVGEVPVALLGSIYYFFIFALTLIYRDTKKPCAIKMATFGTFAGLGASLWFIYLQAFVIKAWCLYCLGSATSSILLFIVGMVILRKLRKTDDRLQV
jgi:uncharacterized membrane protein